MTAAAAPHGCLIASQALFVVTLIGQHRRVAP
jgi:hypothetical protein